MPPDGTPGLLDPYGLAVLLHGWSCVSLVQITSRILVLRSVQRRQVYAVCASLTALHASRRTAAGGVAPASMLRDGATRLLSMRSGWGWCGPAQLQVPTWPPAAKFTQAA